MASTATWAPRDSQATGLTLIEVVVVVMILVALSGFLIPLARDLIIAGKVNRILAVVDAAREACIRFNHDTEDFGLEDTGDPNGALAVGEQYHTLSMPPPNTLPIPGWKGPYLQRPLSIADNPFADRVAILSPLSGAAGGFDLLGNGRKKDGNGNFIVFHGVSLEVAQAVEKSIDPESSGGGSDPATWGRCMTRPDGDQFLLIVFLMEEVT